MGNEIVKKQNVVITNRELIVLSGVEKVKNINENIFVGKVAGSNITIQGSNLELTKLDLESGEVELAGLINSLKYSNVFGGKNILKRLFK